MHQLVGEKAMDRASQLMEARLCRGLLQAAAWLVTRVNVANCMASDQAAAGQSFFRTLFWFLSSLIKWSANSKQKFFLSRLYSLTKSESLGVPNWVRNRRSKWRWYLLQIVHISDFFKSWINRACGSSTNRGFGSFDSSWHVVACWLGNIKRDEIMKLMRHIK